MSLLPKVKWGNEEAENTCQAKYLGSMFEAEAGGAQMPDVHVRIARVRQRFGKM